MSVFGGVPIGNRNANDVAIAIANKIDNGALHLVWP